jgi:hypothetical protein
MKEKNINKTLMPQCLHIIFCGTIIVISIVFAFLYTCKNDGALTIGEIKCATEYFFICITEILLFTLAFDLVCKYDKLVN